MKTLDSKLAAVCSAMTHRQLMSRCPGFGLSDVRDVINYHADTENGGDDTILLLVNVSQRARCKWSPTEVD